MNCSWCLPCYLFLTLCLLSVVRTVPPEYCLSPLNRSDCKASPKAVFSYYKPGSRCEIETWRGCPTLNKFDNEYLCSLNCIFRMKLVEKEPEENPCDIPLDQEKCEKTTTLVYTHVAGSCVEVEWSGCPSLNKFITKADCEAACHVQTVEDELQKLDKNVLNLIDNYLTEIIQEEMPTTTEKVTEPTTQADTTQAKTTQAETTQAETTQAKTTQAETTQAETTTVVTTTEKVTVTTEQIAATTSVVLTTMAETNDRSTVMDDYNSNE